MSRGAAILKELEGRRSQGRGIENFKNYLETIGNIQQQLVCVHIAGTNGKGSVLNDMRSVLQEAGYRVGTFSSPYLETHYDRIRINDEFIPEEAFLRYYDRCHEGWYAYHLSSFEIDTVIAFLYFYEQKIDICLIEAGIGGRYDCTNVIQPLVSVITNIGRDHMEYLGNTITDIAWQKGGIIKTNTPLVCAEKKAEAYQVLKAICEQQQAPMIETKEIKAIKRQDQELSFYYDRYAVTLTQPAYYQAENCACAIEALQLLTKQYHFHISDQQLLQGLKKAKWKGRFEKVWDHPVVILDGAHNEAGITALKETIQDMGKVRILFSALKDKDTKRMLELLCSCSDEVIVSEFAFMRCQKAKELAKGFPVHIDPDYRHAIQTAMQDQSTPLIITGSLYFISAVRAFFMHTLKRNECTNQLSVNDKEND